MSDLAATAQRLRLVKQATRQFLTNWAMDDTPERRVPPQNSVEADLADFKNHDWSLLYRGSVLDD